MGKPPRRQRIGTYVEAEIRHAKLLVEKAGQGRAPLCQLGRLREALEYHHQIMLQTAGMALVTPQEAPERLYPTARSRKIDYGYFGHVTGYGLHWHGGFAAQRGVGSFSHPNRPWRQSWIPRQMPTEFRPRNIRTNTSILNGLTASR